MRDKGPDIPMGSSSLLSTRSVRAPTARDFISPEPSFSRSVKSKNINTKLAVMMTMKNRMKTDGDDENNVRRGRREHEEVLKTETSSRRDFVAWTALLVAQSSAMFQPGHKIPAFAGQQQQQQTFTQRFPTLFKPFLGEGTKKTIKTTLIEDRC